VNKWAETRLYVVSCGSNRRGGPPPVRLGRQASHREPYGFVIIRQKITLTCLKALLQVVEMVTIGFTDTLCTCETRISVEGKINRKQVKIGRVNLLARVRLTAVTRAAKICLTERKDRQRTIEGTLMKQTIEGILIPSTAIVALTVVVISKINTMTTTLTSNPDSK
jgi:hypothetical protein